MIKILEYFFGILSLVYFVMYAVYAGLTNKFTYFWLCFGILCIVCAIFSKNVSEVFKKLPQAAKIAVLFFVGIVIVSILIVEGMLITYGNTVPNTNADYVIVLGAQVRGKTPSYNLARRLDTAYEYLQENPNAVAIVSGGQGTGEDISEAEAMARYLEQKGIPSERLILEDKSKNTYENLLFSREKMDSEDAKVVLVTNNFHVFRSVKIAEKQGLQNVEGLGAPVMWYTIPNMYLREAFAIIKYALCGQI